MTSQLATVLASAGEIPIVSLVLTSLLVLAWSIYLPFIVRDHENRKLPPNVTARLMIVFLYLFVYATIVAAFFIGGEKLVRFFGSSGPVMGTFVEKFSDQIPLLALGVLTLPHSIRFTREMINGIVIWMHSVFYFKTDVDALSSHLKRCSFESSPAERERNFAYLREYEVFVEDTDDDFELESAVAWRKTSTLLRLLRAWNQGQSDVLDKTDLAKLEEIEQAHARKTRLAMGIIRLIRMKEQGAVPAEAFGKLAMMLASSGGTRADTTEIESRLKDILTTSKTDQAKGRGPFTGAMHLSSSELQHHLGQIDSYFRYEYQVLLQQTSALAAKSVVHAGDGAPQRLEDLKAVGFGQLGRVDAINVDKILWVFFTVLLASFLLYFYYNTGQQNNFPPSLMARVALVTALAALTGAIIGSNRRYASRPSTPWRAYIGAGLVAVGCFAAVHGTAKLYERMTIAQAAQAEAAPPETAPAAAVAAAPSTAPAEQSQPKFDPRKMSFTQMLPFSFTPFVIALTICWLARRPAWPKPDAVPVGIWERSIDGAILALVMVLGFFTARALQGLFNPDVAEAMNKMLAERKATGLTGFLKFSPAPVIGFLIGAVVVRDARIAAHSRLTDDKALQEYLAREQATDGKLRSASAHPASSPPDLALVKS